MLLALSQGLIPLSFEAFLPDPSFSPIEQETKLVRLGVEVFPTWFKDCRLSWNPLPSWSNADVNYNVYRSQQQQGGFVKLNAVPLQSPQFVDDQVVNSTLTDRDFYVVEAIVNNGVTITTWRTEPAQVGDSLPRYQGLLHREINRRHWVLLKVLAGTEAILLRKKLYGKHCPKCYDKKTGTITKEGCQICYGTGVQGGYYPSIKTLAQFDASQENKIYTYFGKFEPNEIGMWTIYYPKIQAHDLVIRKKDLSIYRVESLAPTELLNKVSRQICRLTELPRTHNLYHLLEREGLT